MPDEPGVQGSLQATPERPKQVPMLALGRMQSAGTPQSPSRFVFGRSCPEDAQQPLSSSRSSVKGIFSGWKKSAEYSALESQVSHQALQRCWNNLAGTSWHERFLVWSLLQLVHKVLCHYCSSDHPSSGDQTNFCYPQNSAAALLACLTVWV